MGDFIGEEIGGPVARVAVTVPSRLITGQTGEIFVPFLTQQDDKTGLFSPSSNNECHVPPEFSRNIVCLERERDKRKERKRSGGMGS